MVWFLLLLIFPSKVLLVDISSLCWSSPFRSTSRELLGNPNCRFSTCTYVSMFLSDSLRNSVSVCQSLCLIALLSVWLSPCLSICLSLNKNWIDFDLKWHYNIISHRIQVMVFYGKKCFHSLKINYFNQCINKTLSFDAVKHLYD